MTATALPATGHEPPLVVLPGNHRSSAAFLRCCHELECRSLGAGQLPPGLSREGGGTGSPAGLVTSPHALGAGSRSGRISASPCSPGWSNSWRDPGGERPKAFITPRSLPARLVCSIGGNVAENAGGCIASNTASPATTCRAGESCPDARSPAGRFVGGDAGMRFGVAVFHRPAKAPSALPRPSTCGCLPQPQTVECCLPIQLRWRAAGEAVRECHGGGGVAGWDGDHG